MLESVKRRKKYWLFNALLSLPLKIFSGTRDKNTWVFGCWDGERYDDSPRYLYEYVLKKCPEISPVWITRNKKIAKMLKDLKRPVALVGSSEAKERMLKAGVAFYSNGLDDFGNICYVSGAIIICLNHGAFPIKHLDYFELDKATKVKAQLKKIRNALFNWMYFDYLDVTSEKGKNSYFKAFGEKDQSKCICAGLPRYDVLLKCNYITNTFPPFWNANKKYVLYLPTYRPYENNVIDEYISSVEGLYSSDIEFNNVVFLVKAHPAERFTAREDTKNNIMIIDSQNAVSTQELLAISDVLVTDYSSCCIDFCITNKPIVLYVPDNDKYESLNGISKEFSEIFHTDLVAKTSEELINKIRYCVSKNTDDSFSYYLNNEYNGYCHIHEGSCSESVVKIVKEKLSSKK